MLAAFRQPGWSPCQAEISKMCWLELKSKVDALGECFQVTNTVVRNDLGSRSCEMEGLKEEVRQIHQLFDGNSTTHWHGFQWFLAADRDGGEDVEQFFLHTFTTKICLEKEKQ